jgi:hypothetical protein
VIAEYQAFLINPDELASRDCRYFDPIPSSAIFSEPSRYRPSRSSTAAIPVQAANGSSSTRPPHPPPHSGELSVRTIRLDASLLASRHQSSPPRELKAPEILLAARLAPARQGQRPSIVPRSELWTS